MKTIFFDIGETLLSLLPAAPIDYLTQLLNLDAETAQELKVFIFTTDVDTPDELICLINDKFGNLFTNEHKEDFFRTMWYHQIFSAQPIPGAINVIQKAKNSGYKVGFISNCWSPMIMSFDVFFGDRDRSLDFFSHKIGKIKSNGLYQHVLDTTGFDPNDCVMIGDTWSNDVEQSNLVGMRAIWIKGDAENENVYPMLRIARPEGNESFLDRFFDIKLNRCSLCYIDQLSVMLGPKV